MESQTVRRRTNVIVAHLSSHEDISVTATRLLPMSCSNSLNSVIRRYDNKMYFARQGSTSQGSYMRQASTKQGNYIQHGMLSKSIGCGNTESNGPEAPSFSRLSHNEPLIPTVKGINSVDQGCTYNPSSEVPMFTRPNRESGLSPKKPCDFDLKGFEWSPRMDVGESGLDYVVTLEIPGVNIDNVKVEVSDQSLIIRGNRSNWSSGAARSNNSATKSNNSAMFYHRREILQGPYRVVWLLPSNAKKEYISAEIQDGFLRVTIPKFSGLRWLRKAYMIKSGEVQA